MEKRNNLQDLNLLHYFENSSDRIAADSESSRIRMLHDRIRQIRDDEKVGIKYMNRWEEDLMHEEIGQKRGEEIGQKRGEKIERERSIKKLQESATRMQAKGIAPEEIAFYFDMAQEEIEQLLMNTKD